MGALFGVGFGVSSPPEIGVGKAVEGAGKLRDLGQVEAAPALSRHGLPCSGSAAGRGLGLGHPCSPVQVQAPPLSRGTGARCRSGVGPVGTGSGRGEVEGAGSA